MGEKDHCAVSGFNNDRLFPEKYILKISFCPKTRVNTGRAPPRHLIILLKFNIFSMAAVSVKRSILKGLLTLSPTTHNNFRHIMSVGSLATIPQPHL